MRISEALSAWYRENRRELPWRATKDPYKIWISEVMLQQTTISVVIPYFERFTSAFPKVEDLAGAAEEKVLSLWSGLGYYSRARNLHRAAKEIVALGKFPATFADLMKLPGIGSYIAAAIASIAFGEEAAAVDGNVVRVITRLFDLDSEVTSKDTVARIKSHAGELISGQPPSEHNQAMMELGATVCTPKNPCCLICPVAKFCRSRANGTIELRPVKKKKKKQEPWLWEMHVIQKSGRIALVKGDNGTPWLKNTWTLPGKAAPWKNAEPPECDFKHSITHHKIYVKLKRLAVVPNLIREKRIKWAAISEIRDLGTSSIVEKALKHL